ncbi:hypothetical protein ACLM5H_20285 [Fredinandcohnia humi]
MLNGDYIWFSCYHIYSVLIINSFLSMDKELKKLKRVNEKIVEISEELKKLPLN